MGSRGFGEEKENPNHFLKGGQEDKVYSWNH
jgi:hypothetical protein